MDQIEATVTATILKGSRRTMLIFLSKRTVRQPVFELYLDPELHQS